MELAARIIFWVVLLLILTFVGLCFYELQKIEDLMLSVGINEVEHYTRFKNALDVIKNKCNNVLENLDKEEPKKMNLDYLLHSSKKVAEHFYLNNGYIKCRKTDKYIPCLDTYKTCPDIYNNYIPDSVIQLDFNNLDYCPCCGEKLRKE